MAEFSPELEALFERARTTPAPPPTDVNTAGVADEEQFSPELEALFRRANVESQPPMPAAIPQLDTTSPVQLKEFTPKIAFDPAAEVVKKVSDVVIPRDPEDANIFTEWIKGVVDGTLQKTPVTEGFPELATSGVASILSGEAQNVPGRSKDDPTQLFKVKVDPEFGQAMRLLMQTLVSSNPNALADTAMKVVPGAKRKRLRDGTQFVEFPNGTRFMLNRPGLSPTDMISFVGEIVPHVLGSKLVTKTLGETRGKAAALKNLAARIGMVGTVESTQELVSKVLGSDQPFDWVSTALAMTIEGALGPIGMGLKAGARSRVFQGLKTKTLETANEIVNQLQSGKSTTRLKMLEGLKAAAIEAKKIPRALRKKWADPRYDVVKQNARDSNLLVNVDDIIGTLQDAQVPLEPLAGATRKAVRSRTLKHLRKIQEFFEQAQSANQNGSNVEALMDLKQSLGVEVERLAKSSRSDARRFNRLSTKALNALRDRLRSQVPGFDIADDTFSAMSKEVNAVDKAFDTITKLEGDKLLKFTNRLFDEDTTSLESMKLMVDYLEKVSPGKSLDIFRDRVLRMAAGFDPVKDPREFLKQLMPNESARSRIRVLLGKEAFENISFLEASLIADKLQPKGFFGSVGKNFASAYASPAPGINVRLLELMPQSDAHAKILDEMLTNGELRQILTAIRTKKIPRQRLAQTFRDLIDRAALEVLDDASSTAIIQGLFTDRLGDAVLEEEEEEAQ